LSHSTDFWSKKRAESRKNERQKQIFSPKGFAVIEIKGIFAFIFL
jgi:hypothetical protein